MMAFIGKRVLESRFSYRKDFTLAGIQSVMLGNLGRHLDLDMLAKSTALSKRHFISRYKALTGLPPIAHFIHMKMERACYLLDTTDKPVKTISNELGYDDPLYFSRLFRKIIGVSPRRYRSEHAGDPGSAFTRLSKRHP